jgi:hypothetical protein
MRRLKFITPKETVLMITALCLFRTAEYKQMCWSFQRQEQYPAGGQSGFHEKEF